MRATENKRVHNEHKADTMTNDTTADDTADSESPWMPRLTAADLRGVLDRLALFALGLLALIAGWSFYGHIGTVIRTWLDPAYQPLALAGFNLAVLFIALAGIAHQLQRVASSSATHE